MIPPLVRFPDNPIISPKHITFTRATGAFNPGAVVCRRTGKVAILMRVFEEATGRSLLGMALSTDGEHIDEVWDRPSIAREESYEEWGVEDCRVTYLAADGLYAITYAGYSALGPRVCLITTDDILDPTRFRRHGPRLEGDNKNTVLFPEKIGGRYAFLHRPMPRAVLGFVDRLEDPWPTGGVPVLGPRPGTWRSSRVGGGSPPIKTAGGWLLPFHGATEVAEGNVYSMGWCVLDELDPSKVCYVSKAPALAAETSYERSPGPVPQVDMRNFIHGISVVFPEGMVELGGDLLIYYGAADIHVGGARVNRSALVDALGDAIARGDVDRPL